MEMFYLTMLSTHLWLYRRKERCVLFNDALNTFTVISKEVKMCLI